MHSTFQTNFKRKLLYFFQTWYVSFNPTTPCKQFSIIRLNWNISKPKSNLKVILIIMANLKMAKNISKDEICYFSKDEICYMKTFSIWAKKINITTGYQNGKKFFFPYEMAKLFYICKWIFSLKFQVLL